MTMRHTLAIGSVLVLAAGAGCGPSAGTPAAELPSLNVTHWTDKTELYMEYPPLVAGRSAVFAVHLTKLEDFSALNAGRPRIEFASAQGGAPAVLNGAEPSRPGAFRVEGAPPPPGRYRWALVIDAPGLCSPSRKVVSKIIKWSFMVSPSMDGNQLLNK